MFLRVLLIATLLLSFVELAGADEDAGTTQNVGKNGRQTFLDRFDRNRDGQASREEIQRTLQRENLGRKAEASRRSFLRRFDVDRDGHVSKEEARAVLDKEAKLRATKRQADAARKRFLDRFDTNRDGKVTKEEAQRTLMKQASKAGSAKNEH